MTFALSLVVKATILLGVGRVATMGRLCRKTREREVSSHRKSRTVHGTRNTPVTRMPHGADTPSTTFAHPGRPGARLETVLRPSVANANHRPGGKRMNPNARVERRSATATPAERAAFGGG